MRVVFHPLTHGRAYVSWGDGQVAPRTIGYTYQTTSLCGKLNSECAANRLVVSHFHAGISKIVFVEGHHGDSGP